MTHLLSCAAPGKPAPLKRYGKGSSFPAAPAPPAAAPEEDDPLDAFMAGLESDMKKSTKPKAETTEQVFDGMMDDTPVEAFMMESKGFKFNFNLNFCYRGASRVGTPKE